MGHREMLLLLGAIMLFGVTMLSTNRYVVDQNESIIQREYEFYSISLAQSFIEEAKTKAFDAVLVGGTVTSPGELTPWNQLGPGGGEIYPIVDDVDDFDNLSRTDSTSRGTFDVSIEVGYVLEADPETIVNAESWFKRMNVTVDNSYLVQPVVLGYVFSYTP